MLHTGLQVQVLQVPPAGSHFNFSLELYIEFNSWLHLPLHSLSDLTQCGENDGHNN